MKSIQGIWSNLRFLMTSAAESQKNYKLVHTWRFPNREAHAGQFLNTKVLPNGNIQKRVITQYGNPGTVGIETNVFKPNGELLRSYAGIRTPEGTRIYGNNSGGYKEARNRLYYNQGSCYKL